MPDGADHRTSADLDEFRRVSLCRMAERVIGRQEKPLVAAGLDGRSRGRMGKAPGVPAPMQHVGAAAVAGEFRTAGRGDDRYLVQGFDDAARAQGDGTVADISDDIDTAPIEPFPDDGKG